ncbi:hypothetical protein DICVIV_11089 [Dictyocaulus viviparus]|uniref:Uncharacterized protein n=1 Tax=Dictyocaulus viviparus TaxID=29172 RepID=A0A0D8XE80_DICVI|nr:hypothetical protein DICVIV_11089 [Dictyocaulus viviparus]
MANGGTNKIGCALHECHVDNYQHDEHAEKYPYIKEYQYGVDNQYGQVNQHGSKSYLLFVCAYGDPHIKVGNPIYTKGPPCDSCKDRCLGGALCDTEIV